MTKKEFGRMIAFALIVCLMLLLLCEVFELSDTSYIATRFKTFYGVEEDTLDAVFIGSSGVDRYWISPKAYEEYGMTVFPLASDAMPTWLFTNVIDEIYKDQSPELIIIDVRTYGQTSTDVGTVDTRARRVLDAMNFFSINRIKIAFKTMDILHQIDEERSAFDLSFLLNYVKYHTKWADEDFSIKDNISDEKNEYMGFFTRSTLSVKSKKQKATVYNNEVYTELDPIAEESLYELFAYAEEKDIDLLFVDTPRMMDEKAMGCANTLYRILEEEGIPYINYSQTDEKGKFTAVAGLSQKKDFYNKNHVNYYGAEKFTETFSAYLNDHYDFPDHRTDEAVKAQWDGLYKNLKKTIAKWEKK